MRIWNLILLISITFTTTSKAQNSSMEPFELSESWVEKIYNLAPSQTQEPVLKKHKILLFSLHTGFKHWVIPHADAVIKILGEKTGAYEVVASNDIVMFDRDSLKAFDAIVLNNNCSINPKRNLFYDALMADAALSEDEALIKANVLENNLLEFIKTGGGLAVLHGAIVMQNNSPKVSEMIGGSFDYHPKQQTIDLQVVDSTHPLTKAFTAGTFTHYDEPYFFKNAYALKNFKPLLYMDLSKIEAIRHETEDMISYVSWIKRYGLGKVFYASPSHNAQSYEDPELLQFYLNGLQYVLGDIECDDKP